MKDKAPRIINIAFLMGRGSRVPALLQCIDGMSGAEVVLALSCVGEGIGTETARKYGVETGILRIADFGKTSEDREEFSEEAARLLRERKVDLIVMAGWMVLMPESFIKEFEKRAVNIHPSILPAYPGKGGDVMRKQWKDEAVPSGCTLHYVEQGMDSGAAIDYGYVVEKAEDYKGFDSFEEFERAIHEKEDEVLCRGMNKLVAEWNKKQL